MTIRVDELTPETLEVLTELAEESGKRGKDLSTVLREAVTAYLARSSEEAKPNGAPTTKEVRPIWDVFDDIIKTIPEEEFAKLPTDGAEHHDHYLYGLPKKPQ